MIYLAIYIILGILYYLYNQKEIDKIGKIVKRCIVWNTTNPEFVKEQLEKSGINPYKKTYFLHIFTPVVFLIVLIKKRFFE